MDRFTRALLRLNDKFFPPLSIYARKLPAPMQAGVFLVFTGLFSIFGLIIPANGFIGFDWVNFFENGPLPAYYPPWTAFITTWLNWPLLVGITLSASMLAIILRAGSKASAALAGLCLPLLWTLFLGQIDGIALLGTCGLPWLVPLVLMKPQLAVFVLFARRSYLLAGAAFLLLSFVFWGFWPSSMFSVWSIHSEGVYPNDIAIGLIGLPLAFALAWFSRGDADMLMTAGAFATPYLLPYNLLPLVPAVARLKPLPALIAVLFSWLPLSANWLGDRGWKLGWLFVAWLWIQLAHERYPGFRLDLASLWVRIRRNTQALKFLPLSRVLRVRTKNQERSDAYVIN